METFLIIVIFCVAVCIRAIANNYHGTVNNWLICPHCSSKGTVFIKPITKKSGISGGKATGALLTGGLSLLITGLSKKEERKEAYCSNCEMTWII